MKNKIFYFMLLMYNCLLSAASEDRTAGHHSKVLSSLVQLQITNIWNHIVLCQQTDVVC
jgi:hypothetical protein